MRHLIIFAHQMHTITSSIWFRSSDHSVIPVSHTAIQLDIKQCNYNRDNVIWHTQGKFTPQYNEYYTQLLLSVSDKNSKLLSYIHFIAGQRLYSIHNHPLHIS
jgi:hypothetical protein